MVRRTSRIMSDPEVSAPFLENRNIFPNEDSAIRLIGALLAEFHEQWSTGKKYVDMTEYFGVEETGSSQNAYPPFGRRLIHEDCFSGSEITATFGLDLQLENLLTYDSGIY